MQSKFSDFIENTLGELSTVARENFSTIEPNILTYTHWQWDYGEALSFQELAVDFIRANKSLRVYVFCSHPRCFTLGRGLQKGVKSKLVEFDEGDEKRLKYPLYRTKRGGGLTFHYPGQWVFYPIINLGHPDNNMKEVTRFLLESVARTLEKEFAIKNIDRNNKLLGLWHGGRKIASVGIGIKRFVTYHGIAVNLVQDEELFVELRKVNPCGLDPKIYQSVSEISDHPSLEADFHHYMWKVIHSRS